MEENQEAEKAVLETQTLDVEKPLALPSEKETGGTIEKSS